jgi:bifunctional non-homologous end joining protein LigD
MSLRPRTRPSGPAAPSAFEPCIPTQADRPPSGPGWLHEIKHDGFRLIAHREATGVRLLTRNGHDWSDRYPAVVAAVGKLRCKSCVIDGEVVICDEHGRAVFDRLQNGPRIKPEAVLFAFDLIELDGQDLRREPLLTRKKTLLSLIKGARAGVRYNEHLEGEGDVIFRHACKLGCEGIVSKRAESPYRLGRSREWIKTKSPAAIAAQRVRSESWNN